MMRKYFITFACIWLSMPLCGNAQEVEWVKKINSNPSYFDKLPLSIGRESSIDAEQRQFKILESGVV